MNPIEFAVVADVELVGRTSGTKLHMIIMQNPDNARKLLANHSDKPDTNNQVNSGSVVLAQETAEPYTIGGGNTELDALLGDILQENSS